MNWQRLWRFIVGPTIEDLDQPTPPIEPDPSEAPTDRRVLADAAKQLLEDPVFQLAMDRIEMRLGETWRSSVPADMPAREQAYRLHWAVEELRSELRRMVTNARLAAHE